LTHTSLFSQVVIVAGVDPDYVQKVVDEYVNMHSGDEKLSTRKVCAMPSIVVPLRPTF
jgi:hypothetical protein